MNIYNNLSPSAPTRLMRYKSAAARSLENLTKHWPADSDFMIARERDGWRKERWITPHGMGFNADYSVTRHNGNIHADTDYLDHLRAPASADMPRDYPRGWYADIHNSETVTGHVAALPRGRFLAYVKWSDCDGITISGTVHYDAVAAWHDADDMARERAESEREHNEKWNAARDIADDMETARNDLQSARREATEWVAVLREYPSDSRNRSKICAAIESARDQMREALGNIAESRDRLAEYAADGVDV